MRIPFRRTELMRTMDCRSIVICAAIILTTLGCSDDSSGPGNTVVTAGDILNAPVGTIDVDGETVTMQGSYFVGAEGQRLEVLGSLSDPGATVARLWFVSGGELERDDDPEACFIPNELCVSHVTELEYQIGIEFVVALDVEGSDREIVRVRSESITVQGKSP
jgi:hypothetical protein